MKPEPFYFLWGKTDPQLPASPTNFHPLICHLLDVAYCAEILWDRLPASLRRRMASALAMNEKEAGQLFVLLAGLHDLGKAFPGFQKKVPELMDNLIPFDFPKDQNNPPPHNFVSVPEVKRLFAESALFPSPLPDHLSLLLSYALGAHHGVFPTIEQVNQRAINARTLGQNAAWQEARNRLATELKHSFSGTENAMPPLSLEEVKDRGFAPLLAAFIALADWFGSSRYFPIQGPQTLTDYCPFSQECALKAVSGSGWVPPPSPPEPAEFTQLFSYLKQEGDTQEIVPNPLQLKVLALLPEVSSPALWIIEEEMGAGKTEAAFTIFDDARVRGRAHGVYIAMPTQATSNAMYSRLSEFLQKRVPTETINLILAHSHALLDEAYLKRMKIAEEFTETVYNEDTGEKEGALLVRSWFTQNKQTLLAHYGVGTIDQTLMSVLQTRHWFVRLFGLAGKVVVFDEGHAYDTYMNALLFRLIEWLAELDCTVVLLSATLPRKSRIELANAYAKGAKETLKAKEQAPYPRITRVEKGKPETADTFSIEKSASGTKTVRILSLENDPGAIKAALLEAIPGEGCAIVVMNTVNEAQELFDALQMELKESGWNCLLFHARMPFAWRKKREEEVLDIFGKGTPESRKTPRRGRCLLIATQVVEQSLDLDADFMATCLATPVDLILQRMGRLWRHDRSEGGRTAIEPRLALLCDTEPKTGLPIFGNSAHVYAPYTLLRSWLALKDRTEIVLPADIEPLITQVYDDPDPTDLPGAVQALLTDERRLFQNKRREQKLHAETVSVPLQPDGIGIDEWLIDLTLDLKDDDDPERDRKLRALTRDGDPSVTVVLCGTGENGILLASDPKEKVKITPRMARDMMSFSLPTSLPAIYHALKSELPPRNWRENTHLKHCRRIIFENGKATIEQKDGKSIELLLTESKGLMIVSS